MNNWTASRLSLVLWTATFFFSLFGPRVATGGAPILLQEAYVWQRQWTRNLDDAILTSSEFLNSLRILGAEADDSLNLRYVSPDWAAIRNKPITLVVRVDGQLKNLESSSLQTQVVRLLSSWRSHNVNVVRVEIDHDCATARLSDYAIFLRNLRRALNPSVLLSVTALPDWIRSADLDALLQSVQESVLQVHAVQNPALGLFNPTDAYRWIVAYSRRTTKPFLVAVPAYGTRVNWTKNGAIASIESETPTYAKGFAADELDSSPNDVATLIAKLRRDSTPHLIGIVWFRLPTEQDKRGWSMQTLRAVAVGTPLTLRVQIELSGSETEGVQNLELENLGDFDAILPKNIDLPSTCREADGLNGYTLSSQHADHLSLERTQAIFLRGRSRRLVGWVRCFPKAGEINVTP